MRRKKIHKVLIPEPLICQQMFQDGLCECLRMPDVFVYLGIFHQGAFFILIKNSATKAHKGHSEHS